MAIKSKNAAHTAGIFADMSLDGPEIGTLVAVIDRARNLPNRKTMGKQDPYCAMRLGKEAKKTDTDKRGGQTPKWDQELRFTVHDSPDYYKLKCSLFNDDKKTDLIGEAWIDLREVILPGGGQNDIWHQLNFKGKYAGEVRVELTYYDSRPKPEPPTEKKRTRDNAHSTASEIPSLSSASGPRQLGPREIKRRPLPLGPDERQVSYNPHNPDYSDPNPPPRPPKEKWVPETPDDFGYDPLQWRPEEQYHQWHSLPQSQDPQEMLFQQQDGLAQSKVDRQGHITFASKSQTQNYHSEYTDNPYLLDNHPQQPDEYHQYNTEPLRISHHGSQGSWNGIDHPPPSHSATGHSPQSTQAQPPSLTPHSSPPSRTQATPPHPARNSRGSASPTKHAVYRDSPLRQSVTRQELPPPLQSYPDPRFDDDNFDDDDEGDELPPPPPAHRGPVARMPSSSEFQPSPRDQASPRTPLASNSIQERSPLQRLEYEPQHNMPSNQDFQRQISGTQRPGELEESYSMYPYSHERRISHNEYDGLQLTRYQSAQHHAPDYTPERPRSDQRFDPSPKESGFRRSGGFEMPNRAQTFDTFSLHDESHMRRSDPVIVRPRAISPNPGHNIQRKSLSPQPATPREGKVGDEPFGPDSYDVLNPGPSPIDPGPYGTPEQHKEAARQREVDKLRDQGPIIGNDGRIIDPSDHLPADTWAPEPERKNRKPEHVIKIRTREEVRAQNRTGALHGSSRPHSIASSPFQQSPNAPSPIQTSPLNALPAQTPETAGRNRLQKRNMPARPLPQQPYPPAQTSPVGRTPPSAQSTDRPNPSFRHSIHSLPPGTIAQRPALSEYQIPVANSYSPQSNSNHDAHYTPSKQPSYDLPLVRPAHSYGPGDDSLALELSMIDIGPSRAPRSALRASRGYGY